MKPSPDYANIIDGVAAEWARLDRDSAVAWARSLEGGTRDAALMALGIREEFGR
ncbi:MAG: hypothetical protein R3F11_13195 [Verrucomicrobiales bacterium]